MKQKFRFLTRKIFSQISEITAYKSWYYDLKCNHILLPSVPWGWVICWTEDDDTNLTGTLSRFWVLGSGLSNPWSLALIKISDENMVFPGLSVVIWVTASDDNFPEKAENGVLISSDGLNKKEKGHSRSYPWLIKYCNLFLKVASRNILWRYINFKWLFLQYPLPSETLIIQL